MDRALVGGMDRHRGRRAAVAALARLARDLGIVLLAEGIETRAELHAARDLGVPLGQGFLFGHPSPTLLSGRSPAIAGESRARAAALLPAAAVAPLPRRRGLVAAAAET